MEKQNYKNHKKYYFPHHFIYLPILVLLEILGIYKTLHDKANQLVWVLFSIIILLIFYITIMLRQHYSLGLQNRIVQLEFKQRYFEIFGRSYDEIEEKLTFDQIAALRFTHNDEFKTILHKAIHENTTGDEIKRSIKKWKPDNQRI